MNTCFKFEEDGTKYDHSTVFSPCKEPVELHFETLNEYNVLRHNRTFSDARLSLASVPVQVT